MYIIAIVLVVVCECHCAMDAATGDKSLAERTCFGATKVSFYMVKGHLLPSGIETMIIKHKKIVLPPGYPWLQDLFESESGGR